MWSHAGMAEQSKGTSTCAKRNSASLCWPFGWLVGSSDCLVQHPQLSWEMAVSEQTTKLFANTRQVNCATVEIIPRNPQGSAIRSFRDYWTNVQKIRCFICDSSKRVQTDIPTTFRFRTWVTHNYCTSRKFFRWLFPPINWCLPPFFFFLLQQTRSPSP